MATYRVDEMRVLPGNAEKGIAFVVKGKFRDAKGTVLAIKSKTVSVEDVPFVSINLAKGTLEMPDAQRGRPVKAGLTQDEINALLGIEVETPAEATTA